MASSEARIIMTEFMIKRTLILTVIVFTVFVLLGFPVLEMTAEYLLRSFVVAFGLFWVMHGLPTRMLVLIILGVSIALMGWMVIDRILLI